MKRRKLVRVMKKLALILLLLTLLALTVLVSIEAFATSFLEESHFPLQPRGEVNYVKTGASVTFITLLWLLLLPISNLLGEACDSLIKQCKNMNGYDESRS